MTTITYNKAIGSRAKSYAEGIGDAGAAIHYATGALWMLGNMWQEFGPHNCPPYDTEVLVLGSTGDVGLHRIIRAPKDARIHVWWPPIRCKVTHWMPIPKLPNSDEAEEASNG